MDGTQAGCAPVFVQPPEIRELRDPSRFRETWIEERTREAQTLEKFLQGWRVKMSSAAPENWAAQGGVRDDLVAGSRAPGGPVRVGLGENCGSSKRHWGVAPFRIRTCRGRVLLLDYLGESIERLAVESDRMIGAFAEGRDRLATPGIDRASGVSGVDVPVNSTTAVAPVGAAGLGGGERLTPARCMVRPDARRPFGLPNRI